MLLRFKAWANDITFATVAALPEGEALRPRATRYRNIVHTLNHAFVVEEIFRAHLTGGRHGYASRNTEVTPPLHALRRNVQAMDAWYIHYAESLGEAELDEIIHFEFVGGGNGAMSREAILFHLVNHGTYHRGFVGDMLNQSGITPNPTDLTVYLRDVVGARAGVTP
ncbi:DinB family protein [Sphingosinicella sp. CPCC 101087]|uniref:DinB family protein n=1 Tax=Sphingosinicella sp. CPCC 101087 TaxID=2497754 RepID=UPI00197E46AF|nr:DinB family protein [Sphingosinicella sp. CPCC 101087]